MARYEIAHLSIEGFRGINNSGSPLKIDFPMGKMVSVFGENATGKSSIYEAVELLVKGRVERLDSLERTEHAEKYYKNLFHAGPGTVELTFRDLDNGQSVSVTASVGKDGSLRRSIQGSADLQGFLSDVQSETILLDRTSFNRLLYSKPTSRGELISSLLGLSHMPVRGDTKETALSNARLKATRLWNAVLLVHMFEVGHRTRSMCGARLMGGHDRRSDR